MQGGTCINHKIIGQSGAHIGFGFQRGFARNRHRTSAQTTEVTTCAIACDCTQKNNTARQCRATGVGVWTSQSQLACAVFDESTISSYES